MQRDGKASIALRTPAQAAGSAPPSAIQLCTRRSRNPVRAMWHRCSWPARDRGTRPQRRDQFTVDRDIGVTGRRAPALRHGVAMHEVAAYASSPGGECGLQVFASAASLTAPRPVQAPYSSAGVCMNWYATPASGRPRRSRRAAWRTRVQREPRQPHGGHLGPARSPRSRCDRGLRVHVGIGDAARPATCARNSWMIQIRSRTEERCGPFLHTLHETADAERRAACCDARTPRSAPDRGECRAHGASARAIGVPCDLAAGMRQANGRRPACTHRRGRSRGCRSWMSRSPAPAPRTRPALPSCRDPRTRRVRPSITMRSPSASRRPAS